MNNFNLRKTIYRSGMKRTIKIPAIDASGMKQYAFDDISSGIGYICEQYGSMNFISIINNDDVDIEIALDFLESKTYPIPSGSSISIDEIDFREFNITNLDAGAGVTANKITVVVGYEPPLEREREETERMFAKKGWNIGGGVIRW